MKRLILLLMLLPLMVGFTFKPTVTTCNVNPYAAPVAYGFGREVSGAGLEANAEFLIYTHLYDNSFELGTYSHINTDASGAFVLFVAPPYPIIGHWYIDVYEGLKPTTRPGPHNQKNRVMACGLEVLP